MGVKPFLLAPALNSVIGQRLVRKICEHCQEEDKLSAEQMERVIKNLEVLPEVEKKNIDLKKFKFYKGKGMNSAAVWAIKAGLAFMKFLS